ncbi:MAG: transglycosylase SLT domain-containing protein [Thermoanaerobaculia bacterium]
MLVATAVLGVFLPSLPVPAQAPAGGSPPKSSATEVRQGLATKPWTGDLDGMIKRRRIRVLVPYSKTHYFVDRGTPRGLMVDAFRLFEDDLNKELKRGNVRVHVVFLPVSRDEFLPALLEGRGDVAAANLTITPERLEQVDFTDPVNRNVSEIVVTGPGSAPIATVEDLSGRELYVKRSSSSYQSVERLNAELAKAGKPPARVRPAPEVFETEDILEMVNAGLVKATIADDLIAGFWKQVFPKIALHPGAAVRTGADTGWMIRKRSPKLKAELNRFLARYPKGSSIRNQLLQKYLKSTRYARDATSREEAAKFEAVVKLFRKYCGKYDLDYLLITAQGYQESRLDHNAKSSVGAIGVMQVMPATGKDMKVGDITQMEPNIHAGVKYVRFMMTQYYGKEPMDALNKGLFTFAAYNAGPGRIAQLRKTAAQRGLNPNVWFNNVEVVAAEKIGRETVTYVSNIYKYYLAYQMVVEEMAEREKAKAAVKGEKAPQ